MYCAKIIIPKVSDKYKLYIFRSKNAESINTIAKVKELEPIFIIDESTAETETINNEVCYVLYDKSDFTATGITYCGPIPNLVPTSEYETEIAVVPINNYTYVNQLKLNELPIKYNGTMLYYSVIGVDEENNLITHLSKVGGVMINSDYKSDGTRHLYSCDDYNEEDKSGIWNYVASISWDEEIKIGDIADPATMKRFGNPMVETVPIFSSDEINASTRPVNSRNFMVLEIPNPWQQNNKKYNYRKLKSFKIQNVCNEQYSDFSEPTFQSLLPVSLEKMLIVKAVDQDNPEEIIPIDCKDKYEIIRKDGIYYSQKDHRKLGLNKYNIPLEEKTGVFSESSVQDQIKIQVEALPNHVYSYTFYLFDVYGNISEPAHLVVRT
jgi:hypothetical protein